MKGTFGMVLVGRPASSQVAGQSVQEGLCALGRLQAAGQPRPGPESSTPAFQQVYAGRDGGVAHTVYEVFPAIHDMLQQGQHGDDSRITPWWAHSQQTSSSRPGQAGAQPRFRDREVITLLLLMDCLPFPGETQFLGFVRAHHRSLFPLLLSQSQFNRRARPLWPWVETLRRPWAEVLGATRASLYLLDTKPLPVVGYTRDKSRSDFVATVAYGVWPAAT